MIPKYVSPNALDKIGSTINWVSPKFWKAPSSNNIGNPTLILTWLLFFETVSVVTISSTIVISSWIFFSFTKLNLKIGPTLKFAFASIVV